MVRLARYVANELGRLAGEKHSPESQRWPRTARCLVAACLALYVLFKLGLVLDYSLHGQFVMDEFAQGYKALLRDEFYETYQPWKTTLYAEYYGIATSLFSTTTHVARGARLLAYVCFLTSCAFVFNASRQLSKSTPLSLLSLATLLSFSSVTERLFRVRSEACAISLALAAFVVLTKPIALKGRHWGLIGVLLGAAFLCTQKSFYFCIAFFLALMVETLPRPHPERLLLSAVAYLAGGFIFPILVYSFYYGGSDVLGVVAQVFLGPLELAQHGHKVYRGMSVFIEQTFTRNIIPYVVCGSALLFVMSSQVRQPRPAVARSLACTVCMLAIYGHTQPWPYVFSMALVFLSVWVGVAVARAQSVCLELLLSLVLLLLFVFSVPRSVRFRQISNEHQLSVSTEAEGYLAPGDVYSDGTGMVLTRRRAADHFGLDAYTFRKIADQAQLGRHDIVREFFADEPKLWIINYRTLAFFEYVPEGIDASYVRVAPNILLSGVVLRSGTPTSFHVRWPGQYWLVDEWGRPVGEDLFVDGERHAGKVHLELGRHEVHTPQQSRFLLPIPPGSTKPDCRLPCQWPARRLYVDVYTL